MILLSLTIGALIIPIVCLFVLVARPHERSNPLPPGTLRSVLIPSYTSHARLLPKPTKHSFTYPLIHVGIDIDALESGSLDLPGRLFTYRGHPLSKVLGLRSRNYLVPGPQSFRTKVNDLLLSHGMDEEEIGRAWLVTMPSFLGFEAINPLSVWYVYTKGGGGLSAVILEVHNTFDETHAYVLKTTSEYRQTPNPGYDIAWTFPRTFHVSPFNSRNGYYRLDLVDPFPSTAAATTTTVPLPRVKVFLRLLTPDKSVKLTAVLATHPSQSTIPLDPQNVLAVIRAVIRCPLALFISTPRILYEAYKLQYEKRLAMFPRPEPRAKGQEGVWNPPQNYEDGMGVALHGQSHSWIEVMARKVVLQWAEKRVEEVGCGIRFVFRDRREHLVVAGGGGERGQSLTITTSDPSMFTRLITAPTPLHFIITAPELATSISDPELFGRFFSPTTGITKPHSSVAGHIASIRRSHFFWEVAHSVYAPPPQLTSFPTSHYLSSLPISSQIRILVIASLAFFGDWVNEQVLYLIQAKFVPGSEPWKVWERALKRQYKEGRKVRGDDEGEEDCVEDGGESEGWEDLGSVQY